MGKRRRAGDQRTLGAIANEHFKFEVRADNAGLLSGTATAVEIIHSKEHSLPGVILDISLLLYYFNIVRP